MLGTTAFQKSVNRHWLNMLSVSVVLCVASEASAQTALKTDAVQQSQNTEGESSEPIKLKTITLSAERAAKNLLDVPMSISVIDRDTLDRHQVRDIQDMVRYEPGISVDRQTSLTNPFGQLNSFNIRGVGGNRVQILVDGARVQERITDGSRDFVDPFNMKSVEITRGPNSVLWGADALGGVVFSGRLMPTIFWMVPSHGLSKPSSAMTASINRSANRSPVRPKPETLRFWAVSDI